MGVQRVGAEAEVEMMIVDTHVVTEIALKRMVVGMEITIEGADDNASALEVRTGITDLEVIAGTVMM